MTDPRDRPRAPATQQRELPFPPAAGVAGVIEALETLRARLETLRPPEPPLRLVEPAAAPEAAEAPAPPLDEGPEPLRGRRSTTVYLTPPLRAAVKRYSADHDVTLSELVERALRELLEREGRTR